MHADHPQGPRGRARAVSILGRAVMRIRTLVVRCGLLLGLALGALALLGVAPRPETPVSHATQDRPEEAAHHAPRGPSHSGPIAVAPGDRFVWVANPDNN